MQRSRCETQSRAQPPPPPHLHPHVCFPTLAPKHIRLRRTRTPTASPRAWRRSAPPPAVQPRWRCSRRYRSTPGWPPSWSASGWGRRLRCPMALCGAGRQWQTSSRRPAGGGPPTGWQARSADGLEVAQVGNVKFWRMPGSSGWLSTVGARARSVPARHRAGSCCRRAARAAGGASGAAPLQGFPPLVCHHAPRPRLPRLPRLMRKAAPEDVPATYLEALRAAHARIEPREEEEIEEEGGPLGGAGRAQGSLAGTAWTQADTRMHAMAPRCKACAGLTGVGAGAARPWAGAGACVPRMCLLPLPPCLPPPPRRRGPGPRVPGAV